MDQFAKFIELLTNPKVKSILKPEVAEALDTLAPPEDEEPEVAEAPTFVRKQRPKNRNQVRHFVS